MLGVTLFGIFLTPVFYYALEKLATPTGPPVEPTTEPKESKEAPAAHPNGEIGTPAVSSDGTPHPAVPK
jgi:hypothetical protein